MRTTLYSSFPINRERCDRGDIVSCLNWNFLLSVCVFRIVMQQRGGYNNSEQWGNYLLDRANDGDIDGNIYSIMRDFVSECIFI